MFINTDQQQLSLSLGPFMCSNDLSSKNTKRLLEPRTNFLDLLRVDFFQSASKLVITLTFYTVTSAQIVMVT